MSNLTLVEIMIVSGLIIFQTRSAFITLRKIKGLFSLIPEKNLFSIKQIVVSRGDLGSLSPQAIAANFEKYLKNGSLIWNQADEIMLVCPGQFYANAFDDILEALNVYLIRNRGAAADFNLVKDIVERYADMEEEDIRNSVTVPLYLGLMGTLIGIVCGLANLFLFSKASDDPDIQTFLVGISIAMLASFWGLACTVSNTNFKFSKAKHQLEKAKNDFYTFVQTQLLPLLNQSVSSSVHTLHQNLIEFNGSFSTNLDRLSNLLVKNHDALVAQEKILSSLDDMNITAFANANILILKELKLGVKQLEQFSNYLNSVNFLASKTAKLSGSFEQLLARTNNFEELANKLDARVEESNKLAAFLSSHFEYLEQRGDMTKDSLVRVEDVILKSLHQLEEHTQAKINAMSKNNTSVEDLMAKSLVQIEEHTQAKIEAIKQLVKKEEDLLAKSFAENRSHIGKLSLLEDLKKAVAEIEKNSNRQAQFLNDALQALKQGLNDSNSELKDINKKTGGRKKTGKKWSLKNLFRFKKNAA